MTVIPSLFVHVQMSHAELQRHHPTLFCQRVLGNSQRQKFNALDLTE